MCPGMIRPAVTLTLKNERGPVIPLADDWTARQDPARRVTVRRDTDGWRVEVNWKWYRPVVVRHIRVQEDACGPVKATPLTFTLQPVEDAPVIRELSLLHASKGGLFVGSWPFSQRVRAFLDVPGTVSRALVWTSGGPAAVTVRSVCGRTPAWATITATLKADPAVQASSRSGSAWSVRAARSTGDRW